MNKMEILIKTEEYVKNLLQGESSGHDWWHIHRVRSQALFIGEKEQADLFIVELAALLHDIGDFKFHDGDIDVGPGMAREWLEKMEIPGKMIGHICEIVRDISFKGAGTPSIMKTLEGKVVQDADRLDAIGAIGIARAFAFGGHKGREIHNPETKPEFHESFDHYKSAAGSTINHFYEKLLLLKDLMNTETARDIAAERHRFMEIFLEQFFKDWDI